MTTPTLAIRVISLTESTERRAAVSANLSGATFDWAFHDAHRPGDDSALIPDPEGQKRLFGRTLTPGETACYMSHVAAIETFEAMPDLDWLLVMEDDVWIDPEFPYAELAEALQARGIGYLRLFAREWKRSLPQFRFGERQILYVTSDPYGAQGYLIRRDAARAFRARLTHIQRPIDDELGRFWENGLGNHMLFPFPLIERHMPSTLNTAREDAKAGGGPVASLRLGVRLRDFVNKRAFLAAHRLPFRPGRIKARKR
jgi:glycosyl transferase family 25